MWYVLLYLVPNLISIDSTSWSLGKKKPTLFLEKCQISCRAFIFSTSGVCFYCDDGIFLLYCFYCPVCWPRWLHDRRIRASIRGANCCRCKLIFYVPQLPVALNLFNLLIMNQSCTLDSYFENKSFKMCFWSVV